MDSILLSDAVIRSIHAGYLHKAAIEAHRLKCGVNWTIQNTSEHAKITTEFTNPILEMGCDAMIPKSPSANLST